MSNPEGLARELREALDDPRRCEWGGYPWEHLGDAERDVRVLLGLAAKAERYRKALDDVKTQLSPGPGGDEARRIIREALA